MQTQIDQITNAIKDIRDTIAEEGGQISESTVLENYPDAIKSIPKVTHNMQQQIFIFYCYAKNVSDALLKKNPTITWNDDQGYIVSGEDKNNWNRNVELLEKKMSSGEEPRLFVRILILKYGDNIENIDWPIPMPIEGIQGPQGKSGRDGKDGIVAGMRQFLATPIFKIVSKNQVETELEDTIVVDYDHSKIAQYNIPKPEYIEINGNLINGTVTERSEGWGLNFRFENPVNQKDYAVLKRIVSYGNLDDIETNVTDPILLSGEGVVGWTEWYTSINYSDTPNENTTWSKNEIPSDFYNVTTNGSKYLWNYTEIKYDSGRIVKTDPVLIMKTPKAIKSITLEYGVSTSVFNEPENWSDEYPENFVVLWKKETTTFNIGGSQNVISPIAIKGNPGVNILAPVMPQDIVTWTTHNMSNMDSPDYWYKNGIVVGTDLYIWIGSDDSATWLENNDLYTVDDYKWIIIKDAFVIQVKADLHESDPTKPSYVKGAPVKRSTSSNPGLSYICGNMWLFDCTLGSELRKVTFTYKSVEITITDENPKVYFDKELYFVLHNNYIAIHNGDWIEFDGENYQPVYTLKEIEWRLVEMLPTRNIIDLTTNDEYYSSFKLWLLKETGQLIPGCVYKFKYDDKTWTVNALDNDTLDRYCYSNDSRITVNWNYQPSFDGTYREEDVIEENSRIQIDCEFGGVIHVVDRENYDNDFLYDVTNNVVYYHDSGNETTFSFSNPYFLNIIGYTDFNKNNEWFLFSEECVNTVRCNVVTFDGGYNNSVKIYATSNDVIYNTVVKIDTGYNNDIRICAYSCDDVLIEITQVSDSIIDIDRSANFSNITNCYYYLRDSDDNQYTNQYNKRIDTRSEY